MSEKFTFKPVKIRIDKEKLLALQRDIDQKSEPKLTFTPLRTEPCCAAVKSLGKMSLGSVEEGENPVKKEKKHKKGHGFLSTNGSVKAEVKKEKKKKSKKVDVDAVLMKGESLADGGGKEKIKRKKESVCDAVERNDGDTKKKKRKEEKVLVDDETLNCTVNEEVKVKQKKKELKNKSEQSKKKKTKVEEKQEEEEEEEMCEDKAETDVQVQAKKKKKKKEKTSPTPNGTNHTNLLEAREVSDSETKMDSADPRKEKNGKVRKKKKASLQTADGINANQIKSKKLNNFVKTETTMTEVEDGKQKKAESKGEEVQDKAEKKKSTAASEGEECEEKLSKKKKKSERPVPEEGTRKVKTKTKKQKLSEATVEQKEPERKKGKRVKEEKQLLNDREGGEEEVQPSRKKKKKSCEEEEGESESKPAKRKKKKKMTDDEDDTQEAVQGEVVFLSEKSGNTDEVNINQERRQALQIEVDKASQPQKAAKSTGFGQWSTAQFDSTEKQQKFLRLMGGFKKSSQPETSSVGAAAAANMALGKEQQQQLQQGLLGEFDRAHSRRMDFNIRGAGLGFSAPSNKKSSIDINARRSVRFDEQ